jgi:hypothetical protein
MGFKSGYTGRNSFIRAQIPIFVQQINQPLFTLGLLQNNPSRLYYETNDLPGYSS